MKLSLKNKKEVISAVKSTALVIAGTVTIAFGTGLFLVPYGLVAGGMSGMAIVLAEISASVGLDEDFYITVLTWSFFLLGLIFLGKGFALKTLVSALVYPPAFSLCMRLAQSDVLGGMLDISSSVYADAGIIVASVFGGAVIGAGIALAFTGGGSTGGVDILVIILAKHVKRLSRARILFMLDAAVIMIGAFVARDAVITALGVISAFTSSAVTDRLFGGTKAFVANIISDRSDEIGGAVISELGRTATVIPCIGGYSGREKRMLSVSFDMTQYSVLLASVLRIDPNAFVTVQRAHEVNGEGWTRASDGKGIGGRDS